MTLYDKTVAFVDKAFKGKQKRHFERTVYWMEKFYPGFTEAHRIAAYSHDIERPTRPKDKKEPGDYLDGEFLKTHQEGGAHIMADFLKENCAYQDTIDKVFHLISQHEVGGDDEQNALKDADSVSFFETNAEMFAKEKVKVEGYKKVKAKLDWMFGRITSSVAKEAARANYEKWSKELDNNFKPK
ncbi:MAG: DUF4202 family protein [Candidatus Pacebacteria bacterium]|nr:DUF4202 family protein [Candidatus Paceibacterota bacterium]